MKRFITISGITLILCSSALADIVTNQVVVPLTWVGRSTEASASVPKSSSIGGAVAAGLALPIDTNQVVFDDGLYNTPDVPPDAGVDWASWPWYGGSKYQVRHFQATFTLPTGLHNVVGFILFSPYYTAYGDIIPINDNAYFYLNGTSIGIKGIDYGALNNLPCHETDGWNTNGAFGAVSVAALVPGLNVLDMVAEERLSGGGTSRLNVKLLDVIPEPQSGILVFGGLLPLIYLLKRRNRS
jgi:hypothetical protein